LGQGAETLDDRTLRAALPSDPQFLRMCSILGFLLPLLAGGNDFVFLDPGTTMMCFSLAAVGFVGFFQARQPAPPAPSQRTVPLFVFLVWWLGNFLARPIGPHAAMDAEALFAGALLYAFLSGRNLGTETLRALTFGLAAGTAVTTIYAQYQYWVVIPRLRVWMPAQGLPEPFPAANANFYSANCYAPFVASIILLSAGLMRGEFSTRRRIIVLGLLLALSMALLLTESRSTIGLLAIFFIAAFSAEPNRKQYIRLPFGLMASIGFVLLCVLIATVDWKELSSVAIVGRLSIWRASLAMIRDHWVLGVGLGRFGEFFPSYQLTDYYTRYPHNLLLEIFAETGIVGVSSFMLFVGVSVLSVRRDSSNLKSFAVAALGLLLTHSLGDIDWRAPANPILTLMLLALCTR